MAGYCSGVYRSLIGRVSRRRDIPTAISARMGEESRTAHAGCGRAEEMERWLGRDASKDELMQAQGLLFMRGLALRLYGVI